MIPKRRHRRPKIPPPPPHPTHPTKITWISKHCRQEFLTFLRQLNRAYPEQELHLVMNSSATRIVTEPRRNLVRDHQPANYPPRDLHLNEKPKHEESAI